MSQCKACSVHKTGLLCCTDHLVNQVYLSDKCISPQASPVLSIEPGCGYLFSVCWSVTRPLVFALGTGNGELLVYDLKVHCMALSPGV